MGMRHMFRSETGPGEACRSETGARQTWLPPAFGSCECDGHIEDVLELRIPLAAGTEPAPGLEDVAVWALLTSGGLATVPLADERRHLTNGVTIDRHGPFHWKVTAGERFAPFLSGGDLGLLETALGEQPGVQRVMWIRREGVLVVGAPALCANGVQCAVVQALRSPGARQAPTPAATG